MVQFYVNLKYTQANICGMVALKISVLTYEKKGVQVCLPKISNEAIKNG